MFKEIEYIEGFGYDKNTDKYNHQYKIIDTDFEEVVVADWFVIERAIIDCYTKRDLPVAPNLIRCMLHLRDKNNWSLDQQVEWNKEYNPRWKEVEKNIQMYLTFS